MSEYSYEIDETFGNEDKEMNETSPTPSKCRKRKQEEIDQGLKSGSIFEKEYSDDFLSLVDENGIVIDRIRCKKCSKILSSGCGGNKTNHRIGRCLKSRDSQKKKITADEKEKLKKTMVNYLLKSGVSFNHLESDAFREMAKSFLSIGYYHYLSFPPDTKLDEFYRTFDIDIDSIRLPSQEWIRNEAGREAENIIAEIGKEISGPVERNECCLVLDFGKKLHNFLSVFIVFINRSTEDLDLKARPFMFMPVFEEKTTENIVEYLVEGGERFGLSRDQVVNMRVVGDGAANIRKLGQYFKSYTLCSCHSLAKAAERVLVPLVDSHLEFDPLEMSHLKELNEIVDDCGNLAQTLRRNRSSFQLEKLPVAYCQTRWLTFICCCQDIVDLFPSIEAIDHQKVRKLREKIRPKLPNLITALQLLKMFEFPLKIFEQTEVRVHEVAPWLFKLKNSFEAHHLKGKEDRNFTLEVVAKSGVISMKHYIEKTISETHLLSSYLCVGMRKLPLFPQDFKEKTLEVLKCEMEAIVLDNDVATTTPTVDCSRDLYDAPPLVPSTTAELEDYRTSVFPLTDTQLPPIKFWKKHQNRFPRLSIIAGSVFCVLASESICERAFSALNRVFRYDRQSMDPEMVELLMVSYLYLNETS